MDNKMLISMMGTAAPSRDGASTSKSGEVDADAFSTALEKATSGKAMGANQSESVIADKSTKKSDSERRKDDAAQAQAQAAEAKLTDPKSLLGSKAYLYQLAYKNVDTMSLAERQALKADKASRDGVGFKDLQRMMSEQGMKLRDLSCTQLADLTRMNSRNNVSQALETIAKEKKEAQAVAPSTDGVAATNAASSAGAQQSSEVKTNEAPSLAAAAVQNAQGPASTQETAQVRRRREVIDQIVNHMELRNLANRDELHLKLNPEYLGELKIQLVQKDGGEVSARFLTTSEDTREVLSESRSDLRKRVEDRGIRLGNIEVDLVEELV